MGLYLSIFPLQNVNEISKEEAILMVLEVMNDETSVDKALELNLISHHPGDPLNHHLSQGIKIEEFARLIYNAYGLNHKKEMYIETKEDIYPINNQGVQGLIDLGIMEKDLVFNEYITLDQAELYIKRWLDPTERLIEYKFIYDTYFPPKDHDLYKILDLCKTCKINKIEDQFIIRTDTGWILTMDISDDWISIKNKRKSQIKDESLGLILSYMLEEDAERIWTEYINLVDQKVDENTRLGFKSKAYNKEVIIIVNHENSEISISRNIDEGT